MPSNLTKQLQFLPAKKFNSGTGDSTVGGLITGLPSNVAASQDNQTLLGDRIVFGAADALAMSDTSIGTLYGGIYQYVQTYSGSTGTPTLHRLAFIYPTDMSVAGSAYPGLDALMVVTPDELSATLAFPGITLGVFINTLTKGNAWWVQIAGKTTCLYCANNASQFYVATNVATFAANQGVYAAGAGNNSSLEGLVTPIVGMTFPTTMAVLDQMLNSYIGIAEDNNGASSTVIVDMIPRLYRL
jgi:hypothetical protein